MPGCTVGAQYIRTLLYSTAVAGARGLCLYRSPCPVRVNVSVRAQDFSGWAILYTYNICRPVTLARRRNNAFLASERLCSQPSTGFGHRTASAGRRLGLHPSCCYSECSRTVISVPGCLQFVMLRICSNVAEGVAQRDTDKRENVRTGLTERNRKNVPVRVLTSKALTKADEMY